ncbi:MAG: hypothetical protein FJY29_08555 [Betaproteobacteria bacterium]|nr:hypothetical protein [Betaproteobacteria bacterium]
MNLHKSAPFKAAMLALLLLCRGRADAAAFWYDQAERLQLVSATLLDGVPISEPVPTTGHLGFRLLTSLLPKPNPKVGDKAEKVPAAPLHTIPTISGGYPFARSGRYTLVGTAWTGYLPLAKSMAKKIRVDASINQYIFGASLENIFRHPRMFLITSIGVQYGKAQVLGAITEDKVNDKFDTALTSAYIAQTVQGRRVPMWINGMLVFRRGKSTFLIEKEKTEFERSETMSDAPVPFAFQFGIGLTIKKSIHLAISEYIVPNRLIMPRISLAYQYAFGKQSNEKELTPAEKSRTSKKSRKRKPKKQKIE